MDISPRLTHRVAASREAVSKALAAQLAIASNEMDRGAVFTGAAMALFGAIYASWRRDGLQTHDAVLKTLLWWKPVGDRFAREIPAEPESPANDAPSKPGPRLIPPAR